MSVWALLFWIYAGGVVVTALWLANKLRRYGDARHAMTLSEEQHNAVRKALRELDDLGLTTGGIVVLSALLWPIALPLSFLH